ncbi:MAG: sugar phosphate isomerase/epimerase [Oscillospiraceae bacterium]|jgi:sugar phosphate isomerase/epimerase|nr:sugar phosphate isomerase/epimerase [Oscillospiraceae bacterium]
MARFILSAFADEADASLDGQIAALSRNGINGVELRILNGEPFVKFSVEQAKEAKRKFDDNQITITALGSPFGKIGADDPFEPHLEQLKHALELCGVMDCRRMRMFSFYMPKDKEPELFRGVVIDRIGAMLNAAESAGVKLAHENEKGIYGDIPSRCVDLARTFDGRLGCVFDPANFIQCGVNPGEAMDELLPYITWMHIKDAKARDGQVTPAGHGDGGIAELIRRVSARVPSDLVLSIEPHLALFSGFAHLERGENKPDFLYQNNDEAFDAACDALRLILDKL